MICSYCKSENQINKHCEICGADLQKVRPIRNDHLDDTVTSRSQPELEQLHTYDLLRVLRHVRTERTDIYQTMQVVRRAPKEAMGENYDETNQFGQELYREITRQKVIIEEILKDRMGYFPKRIDDKLLSILDYKTKDKN